MASTSIRVLAPVAIAGALVLGCGGTGGDGGASARPASTPTATATAAETPARTAARRGVRLVRVGTFAQPVYVTAPPRDRRRVFVVEREGRIMVMRDGRKLGTPFLDLRGQVSTGSEQGLLSMAFAPDYAGSGLFYVYFTDRGGDTRVVEYRRATANRADPGSARQLLFQNQPESNHNGGLVMFGPDDRLYIGLGDGGGGGDRHGPIGNAQDLGTLLGKILRIDPRPDGGRPYGIPASNPFVDRSGARDEVYSYGLRNPWRFSFDRRTGDLIIGDVGQNEVEEIDFVRRGRGRGANFGWRPSRAARATRPASRRPATCARSSSASTAAATARSPAGWSCATGPCPRCAAATCSATSAAGASSARGSPRAGRARSEPPGCGSTRWRPSGKTRAGGCTRPP
jgi:glucose/arabinose dehydrogenase